jgi:predicted TIM-barrel fold metal-dependent hydrolase
MLEIVDTHQHLWDLSRHRHSWCAGIAALNRSFLPVDYAAAAGELPGDAKIVQAIFVECDAEPADQAKEAAWVCQIASQPGSVTAGVVAGGRPELEGFEQHLDRIAHPSLRGLRRVLHVVPDEVSQSERFAAHVRALGPRGLSFDLCVLARQLPVALSLVRRCPQTTFVLDHCGVPDVKGKVLDPWREQIRELAREPNVAACKVSGLVAYADPTHWGPADLRPYVDHVAQCFGPERLMFGGDWPVCTLTCSLARWVRVAMELTAAWSPEDRRKLFSANARRVYRV